MGSGAAAIVGLTIPGSHKELGALLWSASVDASGSDVRLRVIGAANTTIDWGRLFDVLLLLPGEEAQ